MHRSIVRLPNTGLTDVCDLNLGLLMRHLTGFETPRRLHCRVCAPVDALIGVLSRLWPTAWRSPAFMSVGSIGSVVAEPALFTKVQIRPPKGVIGAGMGLGHRRLQAEPGFKQPTGGA